MQIVIKNGFFTFEYEGGGGSRRWARYITFRYRENIDNWLLHRDGINSFSIDDPENINRSMYTTENFGDILFEDFNIYETDYF